MEEKLWHKSYAPGVEKTLDYERLTVSGGLARSARGFPGKTALDYMGRKITYRELDGLVNRFARALMGLGIKEGDKVAVVLPNIPQTIIANMATLRIGAVTVLNNPLYTERELRHQLDDSDSRIAIAPTTLVPRILNLMPETKLEKVIGCRIEAYLPFPKKQLFPYLKKQMHAKIEPSSNVLHFEDLIKAYPPDPVEERGKWEELSTLIYTGGTTGVSKGVMLSHANISCNVQQFKAWFPELKEGEESLVGTFPVFHSAGFTACQNYFAWMAWEHVMIPRPDPEAIIETLKKRKPGYLPGVPTTFVGLLRNPEFRRMDLSFLKGFFSGAAPLAISTIRDLRELTGATILEVYGLTETSPIATISPWGSLIKPGTVGIPVPDTDVKIVDAESGENELPTGEIGEVIIKGPQVMMGYYGNPDETREALRDGWVYTGDIGLFDEDGYLSIVDRKKDMFIASGYNIYPVEIDNVLLGHPKIFEACTVGVPDEYRGETLKAFIVTEKGATLTEEEVIAFCQDRLAAYKVPRKIEFMDELPKNMVGKVLRRELHDQEIKKMEGKGT